MASKSRKAQWVMEIVDKVCKNAVYKLFHICKRMIEVINEYTSSGWQLY